MSAVSFRSVFMVASCAGAALGCYLVSLRVASERAALEEVETEIVLAQRDIRVLQTEIGTRGRLAQLERWNVKVMALSAPTADQFLKGGFELARFTAPERKAPIDAPVVLASAPKPEAPSAAAQAQRPALMHEASLKTAPRERLNVSLSPPAQRAQAAGSERDKVDPKVPPKTAVRAQEANKAKALIPAKTIKSPARDPLTPLAGSNTKVASASKPPSKTSRDLARKQ